MMWVGLDGLRNQVAKDEVWIELILCKWLRLRVYYVGYIMNETIIGIINS